MALPDAVKRKLNNKYEPKKLLIEGYDYSVSQKNRLIKKN